MAIATAKKIETPEAWTVNNSRISLKNIKYFEGGSEETFCFVATVYFDGKRVGEARNDGHGGPSCGCIDKAFRDEYYGYISSLPQRVSNVAWQDEPFIYDESEDSILTDLVADFVFRQDLKKLLRTRFIYTMKNKKGVFQTKAYKPIQMKSFLNHGEDKLISHMGSDIDRILNCMDFEDALKIFQAIRQKRY